MAKLYMGGKRVYVSKSTYQKYKAGDITKEQAVESKSNVKELVQTWTEAIKERREQTQNRDVEAVYNSIAGKESRYPTIGANTKNFDKIINNAVWIRHYDQDEMEIIGWIEDVRFE